MNVALVFIGTLVILFALAYITKRRFGVLGLALAAGAMLSDLWADKLTPLVARAGVTIDHPPLLTVVSVALVLLPALLLLFSGPSYHKMPLRFASALLFAALATALLVEPLGSSFALTGQGEQVYQFFVDNRVYIVTAGLVLALLDILATHTPRHHRRHKD